MTDLPILIGFFAGGLSGYMIGRSLRENEFDLLQSELFKVKNHLRELQRLYDAQHKMRER